MLDVACLIPFRATAEQHYRTIVCAAEVDSVARTVVNAQFFEAATKRVGVTEVAQTQSSQAGADARSCNAVAQTSNPL